MVNQSLFVVRRRIDVYFHFIGNRKRNHHHLSIPVTIIDKIEGAFHSLSNKGKLKQGNGVFSYEDFQIHI